MLHIVYVIYLYLQDWFELYGISHNKRAIEKSPKFLSEVLFSSISDVVDERGPRKDASHHQQHNVLAKQFKT
jgi:hypothetical protein